MTDANSGSETAPPATPEDPDWNRVAAQLFDLVEAELSALSADPDLARLWTGWFGTAGNDGAPGSAAPVPASERGLGPVAGGADGVADDDGAADGDIPVAGPPAGHRADD